METAAKRGFTMAEACEYLGGISRPTMYRLLGQGEIDSYGLSINTLALTFMGYSPIPKVPFLMER